MSATENLSGYVCSFLFLSENHFLSQDRMAQITKGKKFKKTTFQSICARSHYRVSNFLTTQRNNAFFIMSVVFSNAEECGLMKVSDLKKLQISHEQSGCKIRTSFAPRPSGMGGQGVNFYKR